MTRQQTAAASEPGAQYAEARSLLEQLRAVTRNLPGGLDAEAAATTLLEQAADAAPNLRSAVLVQTVADGALVPIAVRGTRRVPWRTPLTEPGPLRRAWDSQRPVVDRRLADQHGRRRGGALAVVPLNGSKTSYGLLVMEALDVNAFPPEMLDQLRGLAAGAALHLETALLFDEVRSVATTQERDRLARQMHDGVAQELAYIGYRLDDLRTQADKIDPALGDRAAELRKDLTVLISNLRLSITDLKTNVNADRGLGSALGAYIRAAGSGRQLAIHLSLQESPFRLPSEREVALFHVAQIVAQDVRQNGQAKNLWVNLQVDPPSASLVVEHDGGGSHELSAAQSDLVRLGGTLDVRPRAKGGVRVEATFGGESGDDPTSAG